MHARRMFTSVPCDRVMKRSTKSCYQLPATGYQLLLVVHLRQPFEFFEEDECPVRGDLETFAARLTDEVVVDANQMILDLAEQGTIALVGARGNLRFLGAPHPLDRIVVGPAASRALKPRGPLFRFLGEELALVHARRVPHADRLSRAQGLDLGPQGWARPEASDLRQP